MISRFSSNDIPGHTINNDMSCFLGYWLLQAHVLSIMTMTLTVNDSTLTPNNSD